jgi:hypothetical protein
MKLAAILLLGLAPAASAQHKTFVNFQFGDKTLEAVERGTDGAKCLTDVAVVTLNSERKNLTPLAYWSFEAGSPTDSPALRLSICYQGGWNLCAKVSDLSKNIDTEEMKQPLFLPGEATVPRKGCDSTKPEVGWTPLLKRAITRLVESNRKTLEKALRLAPLSREVALVSTTPKPVAKFTLPLNSAGDMAAYQFHLVLKGLDDRTLAMDGCGTGKKVNLGGEVYLQGPLGNVSLFVSKPQNFRQNEVYLFDLCPSTQGISIVGRQ